MKNTAKTSEAPRSRIERLVLAGYVNTLDRVELARQAFLGETAALREMARRRLNVLNLEEDDNYATRKWARGCAA